MHKNHVLALLAILSLPSISWAVVVAYDEASDAAYSSGWPNGSNGGFGFTPWQQYYSGGIGGNLLISSSMNNGSGGGPGIDSPGNRAWTIQSFSQNDYPYGYRGWSHTFGVGDTFSVDLDTGYPSEGFATSVQQFGLYGAFLGDPTEVFIIAQSGQPNYRLLHVLPGNIPTYVDTGVPLTEGGIHVDFKWTTPTNCNVALTVLSTSNTTDYDVYSGLAQSLAFQAGGPLTGQDYFMNRMKINAVPEPGSLLIFGMGVFGLVGFRRRTRDWLRKP